MSEQKPSLHIDTDWKQQAQEEKRRLAEQEKARAAESAAPAGAGAGAAPSASRQPAARGARDVPLASFGTLVSSMMTQALLYLGDLAPRGGEPMVNLDLAKHHIDTLGVLEQKTQGNLSAEEKRLLDTALYEVRNRYVSVASQYIT